MSYNSFSDRDNKKTLVRRGSYEIESDQLDLSLVRPVIDPDPPFYTPYKSGRKSEVFIVDFGDEKIESKKSNRTASRNAKQSSKFILCLCVQNYACRGVKLNTPMFCYLNCMGISVLCRFSRSMYGNFGIIPVLMGHI